MTSETVAEVGEEKKNYGQPAASYLSISLSKVSPRSVEQAHTGMSPLADVTHAAQRVNTAPGRNAE